MLNVVQTMYSKLVKAAYISGFPAGQPALSKVEQIHQLHALVNSASYPQLDGKWAVAYRLLGESLVWLIGVVISLHCPIFANCERVQKSLLAW